MKKNIIYIILVIIFSAAVAIYFFKNSNENNIANGFKRKLIAFDLQQKKVIELPTKSIMFAGNLDTGIVLTTKLNLLNFYKIDDSLKSIDSSVFRYPTNFHTKAKNIYKDVLLPHNFSTNPYGDIAVFNDSNVISSYKINKFRFDFFQAISPKTLIVRARHKNNGIENRSLAKLKLDDPVTVDKEYPLPNLANGLFTNDGVLIYDKKNARIFYMYFYRGEFLSLDTNLNLLYKAKTIDTVRNVEIKTHIFASKSNDGREKLKQLAPVKPPKFVNLNIATDNKCIYILSKLKADNEIEKDSRENQVVDVYNNIDGKYLHSFYIPRYNKLHFDQFQVKNHSIVAIYRPFIVKYSFH